MFELGRWDPGVLGHPSVMFKYVDEYRDVKKCQKLTDMINAEAKRPAYKIMEVCGTHTAAIRKFGLKTMLSDAIELISGPGCPVCVTSDGYLKNVFRLLKAKNVCVATYPDMLRVPVNGSSLEKKRAGGADVRGVNSALEVLDLAKEFRNKEIIFLGVGFETTAPGTAIALKLAKKEKIKNFTVYSSHKTIPEALSILGKDKKLAIDGFLLPGHVSAIIGLEGYRRVMKKLNIPAVISGFEPVDILLSIYKIIKAVNEKKAILENEYERIVSKNGNNKAKALLKEVFEKKDGAWRGLGIIEKSELALRPALKTFDAVKKFGLKKEKADTKVKSGCRCADVLKGLIVPTACPFFAKACTPQSPLGPCMVSREGTCRSFFEYR